MSQTREEMPLDVLFVGGGPANLAGAVRLMQLAAEKNIEIEVGLIEKGDTIGSHNLSGAILDPTALAELIPDYKDQGCPIEQADCKDKFYYLTPKGKFGVPYTPSYMHNDGCHIISLSKFTRWLGEKAEEMGIMIFPSFAGVEVLFDDDNKVIGVRTGDKGIDKEGGLKNTFEPGVDLLAKVTVFGEGPRGSLTRELDKKLGLYSAKMPPSYETAVKEVIELPEESAFLKGETSVIHTFGHPLGLHTKGGGFLYKMSDRRVALGLVVGLDYEDPLLEPYIAFLKFKHHPLIAEVIAGGKVLQQGAKTLTAGGFYTIPKLAVGGALLVGDGACLLNAQRLKGIHTAMKSGMLAAETIVKAFAKDDFSAAGLDSYGTALENSWIKKELYKARNFSPALAKGGIGQFFHVGAQYISGGRGFVDPMPIVEDRTTLKPLAPTAEKDVKETATVDGTLYVDKLTGVYLSGTQHEEDQPCHLLIGDLDLCMEKCYPTYGSPCTRFCPGEVYELKIDEAGKRELKLNPSNCLHCKTCEIKDPYSNITWTCPEGGGGPNYTIV